MPGLPRPAREAAAFCEQGAGRRRWALPRPLCPARSLQMGKPDAAGRGRVGPGLGGRGGPHAPLGGAPGPGSSGGGLPLRAAAGRQRGEDGDAPGTPPRVLSALTARLPPRPTPCGCRGPRAALSRARRPQHVSPGSPYPRVNPSPGPGREQSVATRSTSSGPPTDGPFPTVLCARAGAPACAGFSASLAAALPPELRGCLQLEAPLEGPVRVLPPSWEAGSPGPGEFGHVPGQWPPTLPKRPLKSHGSGRARAGVGWGGHLLSEGPQKRRVLPQVT